MSDSSQWTETRLKRLKTLWEKGMSISQIGDDLGVSRNAIAGKVHRLGLPKRQSPISRPATDPAKKRPSRAKTPAQDKPLPLKLALREIAWSRSSCSWPIGDPKTNQFRFCGNQAVTGKPYCNDHCFEAYTTSRDAG